MTCIAISSEYSEANSRPSDAHQDRLLKLYLARRDALRAEKAAKIAGAPGARKPAACTLANHTTTVEFRPNDDGTVTVTRKSSRGTPESVGPWSIKTLKVEAARAEYRRLQQLGFWAW